MNKNSTNLTITTSPAKALAATLAVSLAVTLDCV